MGQKLGNLQSIVNNLTLAANQITAGTFQSGVILPSGQINGTIPNPVSGAVSGAVSSPSVYSSAAIVSPGSHGYNVTSNYVACWIDGNGTFGTSPSSGAVKVDLSAFTDADAEKILSVVPYWGRYMWDAPDSPLKSFVKAEDVQGAGFGPDIAPVVSGDEPLNIGTEEDPVLIQPGNAWTVNYSQLVVPLLALARAQQAQIEDLETRLKALENPS